MFRYVFPSFPCCRFRFILSGEGGVLRNPVNEICKKVEANAEPTGTEIERKKSFGRGQWAGIKGRRCKKAMYYIATIDEISLSPQNNYATP